MQAPALSSVSIEQIVDRILTSRRITRADQYSLLTLNILTAEERDLINRVFDRLRLGLLKVVN